MRRQKADKSEWDPRPSDRVCSDHFVDKIPTTEDPDPTLNLGYTYSSTKPCRQYQQSILKQKRSTHHLLKLQYLLIRHHYQPYYGEENKSIVT